MYVTLKYYHTTQARPQHNSNEMGGWPHCQAGGASWCTEVHALGWGSRASEGTLRLHHYQYSRKYLVRCQASEKKISLCWLNVWAQGIRCIMFLYMLLFSVFRQLWCVWVDWGYWGFPFLSSSTYVWTVKQLSTWMKERVTYGGKW